MLRLREKLITLNEDEYDDFYIVQNNRFFVHGELQIPIKGHACPLSLVGWAEITRKDLESIYSYRSRVKALHDAEPPLRLKGKFASFLPGLDRPVEEVDITVSAEPFGCRFAPSGAPEQLPSAFTEGVDSLEALRIVGAWLSRYREARELSDPEADERPMPATEAAEIEGDSDHDLDWLEASLPDELLEANPDTYRLDLDDSILFIRAQDRLFVNALLEVPLQGFDAPWCIVPWAKLTDKDDIDLWCDPERRMSKKAYPAVLADALPCHPEILGARIWLCPNAEGIPVLLPFNPKRSKRLSGDERKLTDGEQWLLNAATKGLPYKEALRMLRSVKA